MITRSSFVSALVVASDASHQLLRFRLETLFKFFFEVESFSATKCCGHSTMVQDLNDTVLPLPRSEAEISHKGLLHCDFVAKFAAERGGSFGQSGSGAIAKAESPATAC